MKGKVIKTTIFLLIIPITITLVFVFINSLKKEEFYSSVSYSSEKQNVVVRASDTDELHSNRDYYTIFNSYYPQLMISSITILILFSLFYLYIFRKKQW